MGRVTAEVRALLQERQDRRKAELDASRGTCDTARPTRRDVPILHVPAGRAVS